MSIAIKKNRKIILIYIIIAIFLFSFLICDSKTFSILHNLFISSLILVACIINILINKKIYISKELIYSIIIIIFGFLSMLLAGNNININNACVFIIMSLFVFFIMCTKIHDFSFEFINFPYIMFAIILSIRLIFIGNYDVNGRYSVTSLFGSERYEVNFICMVLLFPSLLSYIYLFNNVGKKRIISILISALLSFAVLLTGSRNGFVCLAIGFCLLFCNNIFSKTKDSRKKIKIIIVFFIILIILFFIIREVLPSDIYQRLISDSYKDEGNQSRLEHWQAAIKTIKYNPLFGMGVMTSNSAIELVTGKLIAAHNTFLGIYIEYGFISLIIILMIIFNGTKFAYRTKQYEWVIINIIMIFSFNILECTYLFTFWMFILYNLLITRYRVYIK